jgi:hypothetical protein
MKSKIFVVVITILIVLPVLYLGMNEMKYRAKHGKDAAAVNNTLDSNSAPNSDTSKK